jgi:hypothetical protein
VDYKGFLVQSNLLNLQFMKIVEDKNNRKVPLIAIDPCLDKNSGTVLFPAKLEKANKMLQTAKLPPKKNR